MLCGVQKRRVQRQHTNGGLNRQTVPNPAVNLVLGNRLISFPDPLLLGAPSATHILL